MVTKQKKFRTPPLSGLQRKQLLYFSLVIVSLSLLWLVFAPGNGLYHLRQQNKHLAALVAEQEILVQQNKEMKQDIERLQNDKEFLEQVAREKHGMLKENEMVFDFANEKKKK